MKGAAKGISERADTSVSRGAPLPGRGDEKSGGGAGECRLTPQESRAVWNLCAVYSLGMAGLYAVLPVLSPYAHTLKGETDLWIGLSVGAYGLTQALFQLPFGILSDRVGRKRVIGFGLLLFAVGGLLAGSARHIEVLILGRLLQGAGAVTSTLVAFLADLTRPAVRTQATARLGIAIGTALTAGMLLGPPLAGRFGAPAVFCLAALLASGAIALLLVAVPEARRTRPAPALDLSPRSSAAGRSPASPSNPGAPSEADASLADLAGVLRRPRLAVFDAGTFLLHAMAAVIFVQVPYDFSRSFSSRGLWKLAPPVLLLAFAAMLTSARFADRKNRPGAVTSAGGAFFAASALLFALGGATVAGTVAAVVLFVIAAALLEPALPSRVTRMAEPQVRGAAMGAFHMSQFLGTFCGGLLGGACLQGNRPVLFAVFATTTALWIVTVRRFGFHPSIRLDFEPSATDAGSS